MMLSVKLGANENSGVFIPNSAPRALPANYAKKSEYKDILRVYVPRYFFEARYIPQIKT